MSTKNIKKASKKKSKGLGDSIAKVTHALGLDVVAEKVAEVLGFDSCGCEERKKIINKIFPYADCLQEDEYNYLKFWYGKYQARINHATRLELIKIHNRVFSKNQKDSSCGPCIRQINNDLKRVFDEY